MAPRFIYRAFHDVHSAGVNSHAGFQSGLQQSDPLPPDIVTLDEHANQHNRNPTPWISTTDQLLRVILRAVKIANEHGIAGVHIAIIDFAKCTSSPPRKARDIRYAYRLGYEPWHAHEFLCKWEIPGNAIVSLLSLQTLSDRGLFVMVPQVLDYPVVDVCMEQIIEDWEQIRSSDRYLQEVGVKAAEFGYLFGAGVHTEYIGLEAAQWWESRVGTPRWKSGYGRYLFQTFYATIRGGTDNACFD